MSNIILIIFLVYFVCLPCRYIPYSTKGLTYSWHDPSREDSPRVNGFYTINDQFRQGVGFPNIQVRHHKNSGTLPEEFFHFSNQFQLKGHDLGTVYGVYGVFLFHENAKECPARLTTAREKTAHG